MPLQCYSTAVSLRICNQPSDPLSVLAYHRTVPEMTRFLDVCNTVRLLHVSTSRISQTLSLSSHDVVACGIRHPWQSRCQMPSPRCRRNSCPNGSASSEHSKTMKTIASRQQPPDTVPTSDFYQHSAITHLVTTSTIAEK